jgi:hypothetical protein
MISAHRLKPRSEKPGEPGCSRTARPHPPTSTSGLLPPEAGTTVNGRGMQLHVLQMEMEAEVPCLSVVPESS